MLDLCGWEKFSLPALLHLNRILVMWTVAACHLSVALGGKRAREWRCPADPLSVGRWDRSLCQEERVTDTDPLLSEAELGPKSSVYPLFTQASACLLLTSSPRLLVMDTQWQLWRVRTLIGAREWGRRHVIPQFFHRKMFSIGENNVELNETEYFFDTICLFFNISLQQPNMQLF